MTETWTAVARTDDGIVFDVLDEASGETRQETRLLDALPLMFVLGGYPEQVGRVMALLPPPWKFKKDGFSIFIEELPRADDQEVHDAD